MVSSTKKIWGMMYKGLLQVTGQSEKVPLKSSVRSEEKELAKRTSVTRASEKLKGKNEEWEVSLSPEAK